MNKKRVHQPVREFSVEYHPNGGVKKIYLEWDIFDGKIHAIWCNFTENDQDLIDMAHAMIKIGEAAKKQIKVL